MVLLCSVVFLPCGEHSRFSKSPNRVRCPPLCRVTTARSFAAVVAGCVAGRTQVNMAEGVDDTELTGSNDDDDDESLVSGIGDDALLIVILAASAGFVLLIGCVTCLVVRARRRRLQKKPRELEKADSGIHVVSRASYAHVAPPETPCSRKPPDVEMGARAPPAFTLTLPPILRKLSKQKLSKQASTSLPRPPPAAQQQANVSLMAAIRRNAKLVPAATGGSGEITYLGGQGGSGSVPTPLLPGDALKVLPALDELIVTERAYVTQLETLVHGYLPELRTVLEPADCSTIFGNCAILLGVNHMLLAKLTDALETAPSADVDERVFKVAGAFLTMLHFLKAYAQVCRSARLSLSRPLLPPHTNPTSTVPHQPHFRSPTPTPPSYFLLSTAPATSLRSSWSHAAGPTPPPSRRR